MLIFNNSEHNSYNPSQTLSTLSTQPTSQSLPAILFDSKAPLQFFFWLINQSPLPSPECCGEFSSQFSDWFFFRCFWQGFGLFPSFLGVCYVISWAEFYGSWQILCLRLLWSWIRVGIGSIIDMHVFGAGFVSLEQIYHFLVL